MPSEKDKRESESLASKGVKTFFRQNKILTLSMLSLLIVATVCFIVLIPVFTIKAEKDSIIKIPDGATKTTVRDSLSYYLGPRYAALVMKAATLRGSDFSTRHGAYFIPAGTSPFMTERKLSKGAQHPVKFVINAQRTPRKIAERIASTLDFTPDSMLKVMMTDSLWKPYGLTNPDQVTALFPEATYEVYWSDSPQHILKKTGDYYLAIWNESRRDKAARLGLSPAEVMTLCSIVDEETNKADDKGKIGRLYINRIKKGMKLQADPTVRYALQDFTIRRVRNEHLKKQSPYNTYIVAGLPPGPIRTTSTATIDSVLNSAPNDYIFMCAKDDFSGYHAFATNYADHLVNARRYQKALNRRGIK